MEFNKLISSVESKYYLNRGEIIWKTYLER